MPVTHPSPRVPDQPPLTIVVDEQGAASVDGVPVPVPEGSGLDAARAAAMGAAIELAGARGAAVRAVAHEPNGDVWRLVVHPDGRVEEDTAPPGPDQPADPGDAAGAAVPEAGGGPEQPEQPAPAPVPEHEQPGSEGSASRTPPPIAVLAPEAPGRYREQLARIAVAGQTGRLDAAVEMSRHLERSIAESYGEHHPYVLHARAVRGHIAYLADDWAQAADVYAGIAAAWLLTAGPQHSQTQRNAVNAYTAWTRITKPGEAERIGQSLMRLWLDTADTERLAATRQRLDELARAAS
ncbi:hypothetical protein [Wenjunlia tyrosinilytica]|jgi:hypothetical protein|uniref:Tetratricopeptide repeat protein n=1 Tax=Wenjunlia tyrosinilytica TaxID=1544741 RepID=A0A918E1K5_9ACTN|nr:hypothetical protein [Wenjunlia tyrosinilytica]GGO98036.1 hypothetical protein GCM10012280_61230 [Wenjunlia tyrosinilytica]